MRAKSETTPRKVILPDGSYIVLSETAHIVLPDGSVFSPARSTIIGQVEKKPRKKYIPTEESAKRQIARIRELAEKASGG
jgi:hypothetical protein